MATKTNRQRGHQSAAWEPLERRAMLSATNPIDLIASTGSGEAGGGKTFQPQHQIVSLFGRKSFADAGVESVTFVLQGHNPGTVSGTTTVVPTGDLVAFTDLTFSGPGDYDWTVVDQSGRNLLPYDTYLHVATAAESIRSVVVSGPTYDAATDTASITMDVVDAAGKPVTYTGTPTLAPGGDNPFTSATPVTFGEAAARGDPVTSTVTVGSAPVAAPTTATATDATAAPTTKAARRAAARAARAEAVAGRRAAHAAKVAAHRAAVVAHRQAIADAVAPIASTM